MSGLPKLNQNVTEENALLLVLPVRPPTAMHDTFYCRSDQRFFVFIFAFLQARPRPTCSASTFLSSSPAHVAVRLFADGRRCTSGGRRWTSDGFLVVFVHECPPLVFRLVVFVRECPPVVFPLFECSILVFLDECSLEILFGVGWNGCQVGRLMWLRCIFEVDRAILFKSHHVLGRKQSSIGPSSISTIRRRGSVCFRCPRRIKSLFSKSASSSHARLSTNSLSPPYMLSDRAYTMNWRTSRPSKRSMTVRLLHGLSRSPKRWKPSGRLLFQNCQMR